MHYRCLHWTAVTVEEAVQSPSEIIKAISFFLVAYQGVLVNRNFLPIQNITPETSHIRIATIDKQTYHLHENETRTIIYISSFPAAIVRSA